MLIRNFLFHRVSDMPDPLWPPMHPALFEKIIQFIRANFLVVLLEYYLEDPSLYKNEKGVITISFDDGYKDNVEIAAPILQRYHCPASFHVTTECIDKNLPTWTYITDHFFKQDTKMEMNLDHDFVPEEYRTVRWENAEEGKEWGKKIKPWMKSLSNEHRLLIMDDLESRGNINSLPRNIMMNWDEVKQLHTAGYYIGSHSSTHPMLAMLANEAEIHNELEGSANRIEAQVGERPVTIAYPIGSWDERVTKVANQSGYKYGLAVEQRFYNSETDGLYTIPRLELYNEPWWKARLRITGLYQVVKKLVK